MNNNKFYLNKLKNTYINVKNVKCKNLEIKIFKDFEYFLYIF